MRIPRSSLIALAAFCALAQPSTSPLLQVPAAASDRLRFQTPLGSFEASDLSGRRWRSADLRDRVTFVDIWDTSCGPCRREHPEIQRFYDKMKIADKVRVITLSTDDDPHRVDAYMREHKYTFPVIVDGELAQRLFPAGGLPQNWIIDSGGRRSDPFAEWPLGRVLYEVERLAGLRPK